MKQLLVFFLLICSISVSAQDYRDVVYLKNGSVIKGFYQSFVMNDTLRMETLDGSMLVCPTSDIVRIAKERTDVYVIQRDEEEGIERRWRPKGYSGSVEIIRSFDSNSSRITSDGFATTHGYRFNRHLFLGMGFGFEKYTIKADYMKIVLDKNNYTLFSEGRWYVMHTLIAPVISCKAGYSFNGFKGPYVAPGIGVDFGISPRFGGFIRFQYRWEKITYNMSDFYQNYNDEEIIKNTSFLVFSTGIHF